MGVVAPREWDAVRAARQLKVIWQPCGEALPGHEGVFDSLRSAKSNDITDTNTGDVAAAISGGAHVVSATYRGPYQSHGTMAPNCAVADVSKDAALVMSSDQGIYETRNGVRACSGCRSRRSACSTTPARTPTAPVATATWPRPPRSCRRKSASRFACSSAARMNSGGTTTVPRYLPICARLSIARASSSRSSTGLEPSRRMGRSGYGNAIGARNAAARGRRRLGQVRRCSTVHLSQTDMYDVPNRRIVNHRVLEGGYLKTGPLRAPMDPSVFFAHEGMMDELAHAAKVDPYEFRKRNISHRGGSAYSRRRPMRPRGRRVSPLRISRRRASSAGAASGSARTTCRRTRAIASPSRRPSSRSR